MSKFSRVARMGSNDSKYGQQRNEFGKGDRVVCGEYRGIVTKATTREIIVRCDDNLLRAFIPRFVEAE